MTRRIFRYWWAGLATLVLGIGLVSVITWIEGVGYREKTRAATSTFGIRVLQRHTFLFNYTYRFQTSPTHEEEWKDVFEFTSDPHEVGELIAVINETTGYVRSNSIVGVTSDSGATWKFFDMRTLASIPAETANCTWIEAVEVNDNGSGAITFRGCHKHRPLKTNDFGHTWE